MRVLALIVLAVAACTSKDKGPSPQAQLDSANEILARLNKGPTGHQYGTPTGKIRVAHMFELHGQPGGPIDIYDVSRPDSSTQPLIKGLAYGQVSEYVSPRGSGPGYPSNLYMFEAGRKQDSLPFGTNMDNSGFKATDQITYTLGPSKFMNGNAIGSVQFVEAGTRKAAWVDSGRVVPSGQALLVAVQANTNADSLPYFYLVVDGNCPIATNDPRAKSPMAMGTEQHYPVAPGTHTLGLVTAPSGIRDCKGKTPVGVSTVTVSAGQRYIVFLYGLAGDGYKTLTIPF